MDFLDPRKRRAYHIRLIVGYILVAIVIGLGTVILVYAANGYGVTKSGKVVQNGLLFAGSKPGGAEIWLNGADRHTTTSARLVLPSGNYTLTLKKSGYRDWSRQFTLDEQSIARYIYPFLFPVKPQVTSLKSYTTNPGIVTASPDRHWLLVEDNEASTKAPTFEMYDTSTLDQSTPVVTTVSLPASTLTNYAVDTSSLSVVEWSTDNDHVLLQHTYPGGSEYVVFDRPNPDQSFNVNNMFNTAPAQIALRNKKVDQLYLLSADGSLQIGDTAKQQLAAPMLKHVLAFKPYGTDLITYITGTGAPTGEVEARIWNNGPTYKLDDFAAGTTYLIDAAQDQGHWYYVASSDKADRINVYEDPLTGIKDPSVGKALPLLALHDPGANKLSFSDNARFIGVENGQTFAVYDIETNSSYQYPVSQTLASDMQWMDGNRFIGLSGGNVFIMDYDGTNKQSLTASAETFGGLFSRDYNHMLTVAPASDGSFSLQDVDMRAGTDLPKKG